MIDPKCFPDPVLLPMNDALDDFHDDCLRINRLWVPGGWLMVSSLVAPPEEDGRYSVAIASTFVSDPEHAWAGEPLPEEPSDAGPV